ncbi:hypothetical protein [Nocardia sp. alder85J]|uniref:hypothetical protein n=1 Tax=Nocardia sp. alder85J TaxID=2862949 RepID=UPI001CD23A20|nr:hypothetical protein [Nocardia sp. alder85J]MCX4096849.1 hypothetical protein [Nocardia sp. alder85J]
MTSAALRPGAQLASTVCTTKVVVVRAPASAEVAIACGGSPMVSAAGGSAGAPAAGAATATLVGKRYVDADDTVELLCVSSGSGELSCNGTPMTPKAAKALPASD